MDISPKSELAKNVEQEIAIFSKGVHEADKLRTRIAAAHKAVNDEFAAELSRLDALDTQNEARHRKIITMATEGDNWEKLAEKDSKSIVFRSGTIHRRFTPEALVFEVKDEVVIKELRRLGMLTRFTQQTRTINKVLLKKSRDVVAKLHGVRFARREEAYVELIQPQVDVIKKSSPFKITLSDSV